MVEGLPESTHCDRRLHLSRELLAGDDWPPSRRPHHEPLGRTQLGGGASPPPELFALHRRGSLPVLLLREGAILRRLRDASEPQVCRLAYGHGSLVASELQ